MSKLREAVDAFTARACGLGEDVRGNDPATKMSLIGPLFTTLGYDPPYQHLAREREASLLPAR